MSVNIKIFDKAELEKAPVLMLNTKIKEDGTFEVFACDEKGEPLVDGHLWRLRSDGRQWCRGGISRSLGLNLNVDGKIRNV